MSVGYRAILSLPSRTDAVDLVEGQFRSWLNEKKRSRRNSVRVADWDGPGIYDLGAHARLTVVHADVGPERRRTFRLREENDDGVWLVSVYVIDRQQAARNGDVVVVELSLLDADDDHAVRVSSVPKLVRYLLEIEPATTSGGSLPLTATPLSIHADDIADVVRSLSDTSRVAAVIVAAAPDRESQESWVQVVTSLTRESVGIATVYVLDIDAVAAFNARVLSEHRVAPGYVRTFMPGADLDDPEDGRRHPFLTPARLLRSMNGNRVAAPLQRVHAQTLRERALQQSIPRDVRRAVDLLGREEQKMLREAEVERRLQHAVPLIGQDAPEPTFGLTVDASAEAESTEREQVSRVLGAQSVLTTSATSPRWPGRLLALIRAWLPRIDAESVEGEAAIDELHRFIDVQVSEEQVALEQLDEAATLDQDRVERIAILTRRIEDLELDLATEADGARAALRRALILEERLRKANRFDDLYVEPESDEWTAPDSVATLVDRLNPEISTSAVVDRIIFTGDRDIAVEVDVRDTLGRYASSLWDYVRVMFDYAELKSVGGFSGNLHMYLTSDVPGAKCSTSRHAPTESETVLSNRAMASERMRPVPASVDPTGLALMAAHFKPTHSDTFAPRMHYFDDTDRTGKIYVGYIGRHLTNTRTN